MSLNWNAFMNEEELNNLTNEQWADQSSQRPTMSQPARSAPQFPSHHPLNTVSSAPDYSPWDFPTQDSYFSDNAYFTPNDYLLGDMEALQPFGDALAEPQTTDSLADPASNSFLSDIAKAHARAERRASSSATAYTTSDVSINTSNSAPPPTISEAQLDSLFNTHADAGFDNLAYPRRPSGPTSAPNGPSTIVAQTTETNDFADKTRKRHRGNGRSDAVQACWMSPLCPNHNKEGTPPSPSTCGGGCAPFLFGPGAEDPLANVTIDQQLLAKDPVSQTSPESGELRRRLKRSESDAGVEQLGRFFSKTSEEPSLKTESVEDSPEQLQEPIPAEDFKGKGPRRRQPHNQVEKKYRESLNTQLEALRKVVPSLQQSPRICDGGDIEDLPTPSKPSKAVVLASATAYIKQMEKERKQLRDENEMLKTRIKALQTLVKCEDCSLMQYVLNLKISNPSNPT